jgi:hypothetical protein
MMPSSSYSAWVHRLSAVLALAILSSFWIATVVSELLLDVSAVVATKRSIALGLVLLVPCMAALNISGARITGARNGPLIARKRRILRIMGANAALVLVPCALSLFWLSRDGSLGSTFYAVQALELLAGAVNVTLLLMNVYAGLKLAGRLRRLSEQGAAVVRKPS